MQLTIKNNILIFFGCIGLLSMPALLTWSGTKRPIYKGDNKPMERHYIGRYSIDIPTVMKEEQGSRTHNLRYTDINEIVWHEGMTHEEARDKEWNNFLAEINKLTPPRGKANVIIRMLDKPNVGKFAKAMFFYDYYGRPRTATWALLLDAGRIGIWIKDNPPGLVEDENKSSNAINNIINISRSYHTIDPDSTKREGDWFYTKYGAFNLPYLWHEKSYIRFEDRTLDLKLEIEMNMDYSHSVEEHGLISKANALVASGYATAAKVKLKRIRSQKRVVAGMPGEEEIDCLTDNNGEMLDFGWEFVGKENRGDYPTTRITMESTNGNLEEKLKIWDAILNSMQPMFVRKS
jgi:hypothetical protein